MRFLATFISAIFFATSSLAISPSDICPKDTNTCFLGAVDEGQFRLFFGNDHEINARAGQKMDVFPGKTPVGDPMDLSAYEGEIVVLSGELGLEPQILSARVEHTADPATKMMVYAIFFTFTPSFSTETE